MDGQNKNLILATVLSFVVILLWFFLFPPDEISQNPVVESASSASQENAGLLPPAINLTPQAENQPSSIVPSSQNLAPRVKIDTPNLTGSISLLGGRIDELALREHFETLEKKRNVTLLSPVGNKNAYYALFGWAPAGDLTYDDVPGANTLWEIESGDVISVGSPVSLKWKNERGLVFHRKISVDKDFMFTVIQSVENKSSKPQTVQPYGIVARHGEPKVIGFFILHEGLVEMADGELTEVDYDDMPDFAVIPREGANAEIKDVTNNGWIGFTDKYWMTTLIPEPGTPFTAVAKYVPGADVYQAETRLPIVTVRPGTAEEVQTQLFAGAKEWTTLKNYENSGIDGFLDSIDWGMFFFLTKPIFAVLHWLNGIIGNMGFSIIALTFLIKAVLLPLAYKSYVSMAKMKNLQPELEKIKAKAGDDKKKIQVDMMALYKREKVNPAAGCLPIILQIPIFFSLYKVIFVTLELRHEAWIGWIKDLSAPDPSSILNLFGLFPWGTPEVGTIFAIASIGVLPIILGISMWLQQKLNPAPTDATQAMIFAWMPWVFMFMLGSFASGLVVYWIANNVMTFTQQYAIMRSQGYKPDLFGNIKSGMKRNKPKAK
ncbi:MAG: membrane protein insertase YidC [Proteobacteria bacterium]|nr:membrane protein insertase YidC [Pseudomonadota bacterium]